jgi:hypothetical protein
VIISLVLVSLQIRQNTTAAQSEAAQSVHETFAAWYTAIQNEPALLDITTRGIRDCGTLTPTERRGLCGFHELLLAYSECVIQVQ